MFCHTPHRCPLGSVSSSEKEHAVGNPPYANSMSPSLFSAYPAVAQHCSCSPPQFPSLQIRLPVGPPFATFFHSLSLPPSPALFPSHSSHLQVQIFFWSVTPTCCSSAPPVAPSPPTLGATKRRKNRSRSVPGTASCS